MKGQERPLANQQTERQVQEVDEHSEERQYHHQAQRRAIHKQKPSLPTRRNRCSAASETFEKETIPVEMMMTKRRIKNSMLEVTSQDLQ